MKFKFRDKTMWHRWFAWHPIWISDDEIIWLEFVLGQKVIRFGRFGGYSFERYQYQKI